MSAAPAPAHEPARPDPVAFIHDLRFETIPEEAVRAGRRALLDLLGVAAAGGRTELSRIARGFAARELAAGAGTGARLIFDGRRASPLGAAFAGASTIDSFDAHDGHRLTKGHAGVAVLPALLALADEADGGARMDGREFLACLVLGYEIATRAGIALHASVSDYHTSGAWNALGVAAVGARIKGLDRARTRHALGTAEYHGPRSQMMRCIDHPSMVKDGSGWGALAGLSAVSLAADGFSGAPAVTLEAPEHAGLWGDLGLRWRITEHYLKPHPVCRWAQPAVEAVALLAARPGFDRQRVARVEIETFAAAVRLGARRPGTTEEAQYALGFPVAAMLTRGRLGAAEIGGPGLRDEAVLRMLERIALREDAALTARFPAERIAAVTIILDDGSILRSGLVAARGDPENPLGDEAVADKFQALTAHLGAERSMRIERLAATLDRPGEAAGALLDAVLESAPGIA